MPTSFSARMECLEDTLNIYYQNQHHLSFQYYSGRAPDEDDDAGIEELKLNL